MRGSAKCREIERNQAVCDVSLNSNVRFTHRRVRVRFRREGREQPPVLASGFRLQPVAENKLIEMLSQRSDVKRAIGSSLPPKPAWVHVFHALHPVRHMRAQAFHP
jgi:hypothetical protein